MVRQSNPELVAERLLDARIQLERIVRHPSEGWQSRYCHAVPIVAKHFGIDEQDLVAAFFRHVGPSMRLGYR